MPFILNTQKAPTTPTPEAINLQLYRKIWKIPNHKRDWPKEEDSRKSSAVNNPPGDEPSVCSWNHHDSNQHKEQWTGFGLSVWGVHFLSTMADLVDLPKLVLIMALDERIYITSGVMSVVYTFGSCPHLKDRNRIFLCQDTCGSR